MKKQILSLSLLLFFGIGLCAQPKVVSEPRVIAKTSEPLTRPAWSPDGTKLLFTSSESGELWEVSACGANLRKASGDADQLRAAVGKNSLLQLMINEPLGVASKVEMLKSLSGRIIYNPALSPQGDKIVFQASRQKGFFVCDANEQADASTLRHFEEGGRAVWTPDGKYIVVMVETNDGHVVTKGELVAFEVATGNKSVVFSSDKYIAFSPAVSPDGKKLAFEDYATGAIYIMDIQQ